VNIIIPMMVNKQHYRCTCQLLFVLGLLTASAHTSFVVVYNVIMYTSHFPHFTDEQLKLIKRLNSYSVITQLVRWQS
jgi:hypothetical protein